MRRFRAFLELKSVSGERVVVSPDELTDKKISEELCKKAKLLQLWGRSWW